MVLISCLYDSAFYYTPKELGEKHMYNTFFSYPITSTQTGVLNLVTYVTLCSCRVHLARSSTEKAVCQSFTQFDIRVIPCQIKT